MPRVLRWAIGGVLALLALGLAIAFGFTLFAVSALPPLQPWHTELLHKEFSAARHAGLDFEAYRKLESELFDELNAKTEAWARDGTQASCARGASAAVTTTECADAADEALVNSRFNKTGWLHRLADGRALQPRLSGCSPSQPLGQALLLHGLTDSPYSVCAPWRNALHGQGLRGDGAAAARPRHLAVDDDARSARATGRRRCALAAARRGGAGAGRASPSTSAAIRRAATLAMQYALDALQDASLRRPDRVLLVSPAIELTRVASLTELIDVFDVLPLPVLDKVHWQAMAPEFDPVQVQLLSGERRAPDQPRDARVGALVGRRRARRTAGATAAGGEPGNRWSIPPSAPMAWPTGCTPGCKAPSIDWCMFDINRLPELRGVARPAARALIDRLASGTARLYRSTSSAMPTPRTSRVGVLAAGAGRWPQDMRARRWTGRRAWCRWAMSALPFPGGRPGVRLHVRAADATASPSIGSWLLRGENGAITIALGSLTRLRSNPFWATDR